MELPENVKLLIDGYELRGDPIPDHYKPPELLPEARVYLNAFDALEHDRPLGFGGAGGIQFTAISCYAERIGITGQEEFWVFERMIRACDTAWLKHVRNRDKEGGDSEWEIADEPLIEGALGRALR